MKNKYAVVVGILVEAESEDSAISIVSQQLHKIEEFESFNVDYAD